MLNLKTGYKNMPEAHVLCDLDWADIYSALYDITNRRPTRDEIIKVFDHISLDLTNSTYRHIRDKLRPTVYKAAVDLDINLEVQP